MSKSPEAFRTISEVSDWLETPAHVLRFWESKFTQIKPVKRAGGRRYYRPEDMALLGGIKHLLHVDGMTIKGVQKVLREKGVRHVATLGPTPLNGAWIAAEDVPPDAADDLPVMAMTDDPAPPVDSMPRPGLLAAILRVDPPRILRQRTRIAPLLDRLAEIRSRIAIE